MRLGDVTAAGAVLLLAACSKTEEHRPAAAPLAKSHPAVATVARATPVATPTGHMDPRALFFYSRQQGSTCFGSPPLAVPEFLEESEAIRITGGATRSGAILQVGATRFEDKSFETHEADGAEYVYRGRFAGSTVHVVEGTHYEWVTWTLVDMASGARFEMATPPAPSPDGRTFAGVMDDSEGGGYDGLEIVELRNGEFRGQQFDGGLPCDLRWVSPDEFEVKVAPAGVPNYEAQPSMWKRVRVVRDGDAWRMVQPST